ncbi:MAG: hypothetical protein K9M49_07220, partial [Candidatus Marinimicrobia bacterium]|nr:hypothetical protein [Candidatus Neomarinimicrobiota bacterium]
MLAIHIARDTIKYAQLVNFKGAPFIESLGKVDLEDILQFPDTSNAEITRSLSEKIVSIRNSAEFPDNATHLVIDSSWFPTLVHAVEDELSEADRDKYLEWRFTEMLDSTADHYKFTHQPLGTGNGTTTSYLSVAIPNTFNTWVERITRASELAVQNVIMDIQALGELLAATGKLDSEGNLQVLLENHVHGITCTVFSDKDFMASFQADLDDSLTVTPTVVKGEHALIKRIVKALERALRGEQNPDTALSKIYYFTSNGR